MKPGMSDTAIATTSALNANEMKVWVRTDVRPRRVRGVPAECMRKYRNPNA